ncbi:MAG: hypothetical protein DMD65_14905 [Gemmatimonadetes bacterium]|nr:MAG: hypothetical protein DMD65_14905 [Gemmatimonadota bacterium]
MRRNAASATASISYSHIPGRAACIAAMWPSPEMSTAVRSRASSSASFTRRSESATGRRFRTSRPSNTRSATRFSSRVVASSGT